MKLTKNWLLSDSLNPVGEPFLTLHSSDKTSGTCDEKGVGQSLKITPREGDAPPQRLGRFETDSSLFTRFRGEKRSSKRSKGRKTNNLKEKNKEAKKEVTKVLTETKRTPKREKIMNPDQKDMSRFSHFGVLIILPTLWFFQMKERMKRQQHQSQ